MATTKLTNMVVPEVVADMVSASLPSAIKFAPLAKVDDSLVGVPGGTVTVASFKFVGDAADLVEGVAMDTTLLETVSNNVTIKSAGKAVEISDQAALSSFGDPIGEATSQVQMAIASKIDADCVKALETATVAHDISAVTGADTISYNAIVDAIDKFGDEDDSVKYLFIHPKQRTLLRKDANFLRETEMGDSVIKTGIIGEIAGAKVVVSSKVSYDDVSKKYTNLVVKEGALGLFLKRDVNVETGRDILAKTTVISSDSHYATALVDDSKVVKLICK